MKQNMNTAKQNMIEMGNEKQKKNKPFLKILIYLWIYTD